MVTTEMVSSTDNNARGFLPVTRGDLAAGKDVLSSQVLKNNNSSVWLDCEDYLVNGLQVCQNKAARLVTKLDRYTPTKDLMKQCGLMPVKHLLIYHSLKSSSRRNQPFITRR